MKTHKSEPIALPSALAAYALATLALPSCTNVPGGGLSFSHSSEGGDVPSTIQFQHCRFRTGGAFRAAELGTIGLKRTAGPNVFENKMVPMFDGLDLSRSASFTKTTKSEYKLIGSLSSAEIQGFNLDGSMTLQGSEYQSGIYTIYYLPNTLDIVRQLNTKDNEEICSLLRQSKDFRIVTAVVKVNSHSLLRKSGTSGEIDFKLLEAFSKEGTATAKSTTDNKAATGGATDVKITDTGAAGEDAPSGLSIADGGTYAYEYSRVIWDKKSGKILDLIVDQPGRWFSWTDAGNHRYTDGVSDPDDIHR